MTDEKRSKAQSITKKNNNKINKKDCVNKDSFKNQSLPILIFSLSIVLFFINVIEGESVWNFFHKIMWGLFGGCCFLWPFFLIGLCVNSSRSGTKINNKFYFSVALIVFLCTANYIFSLEETPLISKYFGEFLNIYKTACEKNGPGVLGCLFGLPLLLAFGSIGAKIVILACSFVCIMFLTRTSLISFLRGIRKPFENFIQRVENQKALNGVKLVDNLALPIKNTKKDEKILGQDTSAFEAAIAFSKKQKIKLEKDTSIDTMLDNACLNNKTRQNYLFPPTTLLEETKKIDQKDITEELHTNGQMLIETLKSFGVLARITNICRGPAVTRYELQPAAGVKISKITNLADDIALNLAALGVRIEAPIPGKAAVGIEIPNKIISVVRMRELLSCNEFISLKSKLSVVLGRDITGEAAFTDLSKMPHILIAGSTGSGKSVCINSFLVSLLYKASPSEVRFLMIDPKVVELGIYNGIPHLLVPVVTDPKKASGALSWAVSEMLKRYKIFAENNVRDLSSYNLLVRENESNKKNKNKSGEEKLELMPQIVIVIDELADLMMASPREVEDSICRLAQMARAAGMHLVIATQRPSVDVITGIIKANIPSRVALAVSSQIDSRTILDATGAEKLLGRGDMLFSPIGAQKPIRIQGCYVTDKEIESVIEHIKEVSKSKYDEEIVREIEKNAALKEQNSDEGLNCEQKDDPKFKEAVRCVVELGQASTSLLQRRLRLGYARAGRLIDQMETRGIVGPSDGSKPRQVLISQQEFLESFCN